MNDTQNCELCKMGQSYPHHCIYPFNQSQCPMLKAHEEYVNEKRWKKDE